MKKFSAIGILLGIYGIGIATEAIYRLISESQNALLVGQELSPTVGWGKGGSSND